MSDQSVTYRVLLTKSLIDASDLFCKIAPPQPHPWLCFMIARVPDLKKMLVAAGVLVYRSTEDGVLLAERVRENLIMDANVGVFLRPTLRVRVVSRAQRSDFPSSSETAAVMFERARRVVASAVEYGFREVGTEVVPQLDPVDSTLALDTWYQVCFEKELASEDALIATVNIALGLDKVAPR